MTSLERQFNLAMEDIYRRAKSEAGYTPSIFFQMISDRGGLATATYLINAPKPSDGYTRLYELGRLDLTVEAVVVENKKWHELFTTSEIERARMRLVQYGCKPST